MALLRTALIALDVCKPPLSILYERVPAKKNGRSLLKSLSHRSKETLKLMSKREIW